MDECRGVSKREVEDLFEKVTAKRYSKAVDFHSLSEELSKLKYGGCLTYQQLEAVSNPHIWPFDRWWRWPERSQIEESLKRTDGIFIELADLPNDSESRHDVEKKIVKFLYSEVFRNIELVSIVLRFIDEYNFGIYSPPVAYLINPPRGYSHSSEYLSYLRELRKYRDIYELDKVAYVDMFLWAIEVIGDERAGIISVFHRDIKKSQRDSALKEIARQELFRKSDLRKAEFYYEIKLYNTAAKWAGCAIEEAFRDKYRRRGFSLWRADERRKSLCDYCMEHPKWPPGKKQEIVWLRNNAAHPSGHDFLEKEVAFMIGVAKEAANE